MYFGLAFAFTIIGLTAGYLVAASETPVVSAALPVLAGLASAAIAVVAGRADLERIGTYVKDLAEVTKQRDPAAEVATLTRLGRLAEDHTRSTVRALGLLTTLFAVGFAGGLSTGTWVRVGGHVNAWAHPVAGPWNVPNDIAPRTMVDSFEGALYWLGLEQQLRRSGVPKETIAALYDQYVRELNEVVSEREPSRDPQPAPGRAALTVSPSTVAHHAVAGGTFASVAPIAPWGTRIPDAVPAVHMEAMEALLAARQALGTLPDPAPPLFMEALEAAREDLAALRRDGSTWTANTLELSEAVAALRLQFDELPSTHDVVKQFEALGSQIATPLCWTPSPIERFGHQGRLGIDSGNALNPRFGVPEDVGTQLPGFDGLVPPMDENSLWLDRFSLPSAEDLRMAVPLVPSFDAYFRSGSMSPCAP